MAIFKNEADSSPLPSTHLIIVCCHGIWQGGPAQGHDESEWLIADFQKGETPTFVKHVRAGLDLAVGDENSVLCFSGGPTRKETTVSEAASYLALLKARFDSHFNRNYNNSDFHQFCNERVLLEERALDSFQNVLFSLTCFHARLGRWPTFLTVVSHAFKRRRIVDLHVGAALRFPLDRVAYVGIDPEDLDLGKSKAAADGIELAERQWAADPYGLGGELEKKRRCRNPWGVWQGVFMEKCYAEGYVLPHEAGGLLLERMGEHEVEMISLAETRPWEDRVGPFSE